MKNLLLIILFFSGFILHSQVSIDTTKYFDSYNTGSIKRITSEEVCAIVVFVSGKGESWSESQKKKILAKNRSKFKLLKRELKKFDIDFKIKFQLVNIESDFKVDSVVNYYSPDIPYDSLLYRSFRYSRQNVKKIWKKYSSSNDPFFKEKQYKNYKGGHFLLIHHLGAGRSFADPDYSISIDTVTIPENFTYFELDHNFKKLRGNTLSHEFLHLAGAWDLYMTGKKGYTKEDIDFFYTKFTNSIMQKSKYISIDPFTAWRIGLNDNPEPWYFEKIPEKYLRSLYDD